MSLAFSVLGNCLQFEVKTALKTRMPDAVFQLKGEPGVQWEDPTDPEVTAEETIIQITIAVDLALDLQVGLQARRGPIRIAPM